ncbi:rod shape-determining protein MreC [Caldibacillus lycopersici]|uniref:Cell shape-determining protein MreC n=1 Tax=Perspicuibacillus lycopersici TaxID=1325689 RepID=A0AAE3ITS5_9BACI|nr:rod shape-determining protein MreC [Perspicuibacillus lycopersici]MCU9614012.1 rod shape-determining protein MreC [Perspicuibacillus lycopersici]
MPQFFMNKRLIILLVGIILLVALIGFSLRERDNLSWPEQFVKDTAGFVQSIFAKPAHSIAGFVGNVQDLLHTYEENEILKKRLDEYAQLKIESDRLEKENEELKAIIEKKEDLASYNPLPASVISRSFDRWDETLIINKGENQGIKTNMAVVTSEGMIGTIKSTSKLSSTVQLLTTIDRANRIHVAVQAEKDVYGLIEGYDAESKMLLIKQIPSNSKVEKGQNVITSGLGGMYRKGLFIGTIEKVEPDQYGLTQTAYVKPAANFYNIEEVIVIERLMDQPDEDVVDNDE